MILKHTKTFVAVFVLAGLVSSAAVSANEPEDKKTTVSKSENLDPDKKICRRVRPTGSHMTKKVCMKAHEWKKLQNQAHDAMQNFNY